MSEFKERKDMWATIISHPSLTLLVEGSIFLALAVGVGMSKRNRKAKQGE